MGVWIDLEEWLDLGLIDDAFLINIYINNPKISVKLNQGTLHKATYNPIRTKAKAQTFLYNL